MGSSAARTVPRHSRWAEADLGYRVLVVRDAACSSSDEGHDMLMRLYHVRFSEQIETADAAAVLERWT